MSLPKELSGKIPKYNPDDLIGRSQALIDLRRGLEQEQRMLVVNGMGGIGKTSLAMAYVFKHYEEYKHIVWLTADKALEHVIAEQVVLLQNLQINPEGIDPKSLLRLTLHRLNSVAQPRLLILDSATQELEKYHELLPDAPSWHVIVTSREKIEGYTKYLQNIIGI